MLRSRRVALHSLRSVLALVSVAVLACASEGAASDLSQKNGEPGAPACFDARSFQEAWIKVAERSCLKCHTAEGDASDSEFLLRDVARLAPAERPAAIQENCGMFARMASLLEGDDRPRLLAKATGGLDHGGGEVVKAGSTELRVLENFVRSRRQPTSVTSADQEPIDDGSRSLFDGVQMVSDSQLLRRLTLSLAARLPSESERAAVGERGLEAIESILDSAMQEDAFYERLLEGFNDIFLTRGLTDNAETVLSYDHFQHSRLWYQNHSLDHIPEKDRQRARYKLADDYREAMLREPLELIRYIVKENRPFTEILTANYTMMSPYTARGYGQYEEMKDQFKNADDPFEFIPVRVKALKHRDGKTQPTADGYYPHAGLLTMFQYLRRYPTTETNRNRLRARMYYQHFLGVDIMNLAPRVSDAAAIDAKYEIPTMQAAECVVCHKTIDPVAGLFQDYYSEEGYYHPRKEGWFTDMFSPGREGGGLPETEKWRSLQWLAEKTTHDPRFALAMAEHVYYILMGRRVLPRPDDIDDPNFAARRRAYLAQRELIERAADRFRRENSNLKAIFKELAVSPFYRADSLASAAEQPERRAELDDIGLVRMLAPEQVERKIQAVFGKPWGRLKEGYAILYGGIDSKEVTERLTEPSGAIGALQRMLANDVACKNVAADFALPPEERRLFPHIEPDVTPATGNAEAEGKIRAAIVHLHRHLLGRDDQPDGPEVDRTYQLFVGVVDEAASRGRFEPIESYFCKSAAEGPRDADPHYTLRAWRAVVTYLLRQPEFLYE